MTRFTRLTAIDAFSYRHLDFDFRTGLSAIEGVNGSSKSSIFMVLCQGLFNRNPKGCKVDEVNNYITKQPYEITVWFEKGEDKYVVVNSRKTGKITISRNGKDISCTRIPENLSLIVEILGTDYNGFADLIYQSKDTTLNILETSTDKGRKEFVARIIKLEEVDSEHSKMKEREKELVGKNGRIVSLTSSIQTLESALGELREIEDEYDITPQEKTLQMLNLEAGRFEDDVLILTREVKEIEEEVAAWKAEQELRAKLESLSEGFEEDAPSDMADLLETVNHFSDQLAKLQLLTAERSTLKTQLERFQGVKKQRVAAQEALDALERPEMDYEGCKSNYEKIGKARSARQSSLDQCKKDLEKFDLAQAKGVCPTCGNEADVSVQIADLCTEIRIHTAYIEKCDASYKKYDGWIKQWRVIHSHEEVVNNLLAIELGAPPKGDLKTVTEELAHYAMQTKMFSDDLAEAKEAYQKAADNEKRRVEILQLRSQLTRGPECKYGVKYEDNKRIELSFAKFKAKELRDEIEELSKLVKYKTEHNMMVRAGRALNEQIKEQNLTLQLQIDQLKKELEQAETKLERVKTWLGILGSKGYRVARIKKFLASLNKLMGKYAQMISGGRIKCLFFITETGEIDFTITDEAKQMAYELWSGGEKARVKLVCLFAVLELLESMEAVSFNVLALDEIFDQLDNEGKEGLFNVLTYLKGHDKAIYTIAHSDMVLDIVYDFKIKAEKLEDGTTTVYYV